MSGFLRVVERAVPTLARLYDFHAEECARAAEQTDNPKRREMLIKLAMQWRQEAQTLRQSPQPNRSEDDGKAATRKSAPKSEKRTYASGEGPGGGRFWMGLSARSDQGACAAMIFGHQFHGRSSWIRLAG